MEKKSFTLDHPITLRRLTEYPPGGLSEPNPGTAAYEYLSNQKSINYVGEDHRVLGVASGPPWPHFAVIVFDDGSYLPLSDPIRIN